MQIACSYSSAASTLSEPMCSQKLGLIMCIQVSEAYGLLQRAVHLSHPAPPARFLTLAAAACLEHGLQQSTPGSGRLLVLHPITYSQLAEHVKAKCPEVSDVLVKLQGRAGSKYFPICRDKTTGPLMVALNLNVMILPHHSHTVTHIMADIEFKPLGPQSSRHEDPSHDVRSISNASPAGLEPSYSTDSIPASQTAPSSSSSAVLTVRRPASAPLPHAGTASDVSFWMLLPACNLMYAYQSRMLCSFFSSD